MINATLRDPARDSASFRRKIDGLFRQIHSIKGEASAIGLGSMEARAHALESDLAALRERTDLTGDDFLPLLTKFDDLVSHSQSVREMVTKLASFRDSFGNASMPPAPRACRARVDRRHAPRARRSPTMPWPPKQRCSVRRAKASSPPRSSSPIASPTITARRSS